MLTIVAKIRTTRDQIDRVRSELERLIPATLAEPGCLQYDLHQDNEDPALFLFYENWKSREQWQAHMNAPHLATYRAATEGAVVEFVLHEMTKIP